MPIGRWNHPCNDLIRSLLVDGIEWEGLNSQCTLATIWCHSTKEGSVAQYLGLNYTMYVNTLAGLGVSSENGAN